MNSSTIKSLCTNLLILPLLIGLPLTASGISTVPIEFDPDGNNGGNPTATIGAMDWFVGQSLVTGDPGDSSEDPPIDPANAIPWPENTTKSVQTFTHGKLGILLAPDGSGGSPNGMDTLFEITFVMGVGVEGTSNANTQNILFTEDPHPRFVRTFEMYYDDFTHGSKQDALTGLGYGDGDLILKGVIVDAAGNFSRTSDDLETYDGFGGDDYGILSIHGDGSFSTTVLVESVDSDFFKDLGQGSLVLFTNEQNLAFGQNNPSANFEIPDGGGTIMAVVGDINGASGPDMEMQVDPSSGFTPLELALSCRMTGGGNDTAGIYTDPVTGEQIGWDGTEASGNQTFTETIITVKGKSGKVTTEEVTSTNVYTFGGQAGASTNGSTNGQPKGERQHVNHSGPAGQWAFHIGTSSAPPGTEIDEIVCSDPGWCQQARPAPTKQIDYHGIGSFRNIDDIGNLNDNGTCATLTKTTGKPSERGIGTYNWAEFHVEDRGEPGKEGQHTIADPALCPAIGTGTDAFDNFFGPPVFNAFTCESDGGPDCPDFYRIRIYCGVEPEFDGDGNLSNFAAIEAQKFNAPIYEVFGYIDGGNFQIHPPTGFDLK